MMSKGVITILVTAAAALFDHFVVRELKRCSYTYMDRFDQDFGVG